MGKMSCKGLDEFASDIYALDINAERVLKRGVYAGMNVVVKAVAKEIDALPIDEKQEHGIKKMQKQGLQHGLGIAKIEEKDGVVDTKTGFAGYNLIKTKKYPNGQPNAMIARAVVSGTSFREKNDFIGRAMKAAKAEAIRAAGEEMDRAIKNLEGN